MDLAECKAIMIWSFDDAPEELRKLSGHGGDEDLLVFLPGAWTDNAHTVRDYRTMLQSIHFAEPSVEWHKDGLVLIYAHA